MTAISTCGHLPWPTGCGSADVGMSCQLASSVGSTAGLYMGRNTCYCCDDWAVGQGDHVPPIALFPKGAFSSTKPIIVPSCLKHNQEMSEADEHLKFVLISSSEGASRDVTESTVRGIVRLLKRNSTNLSKFGVQRTEKGISIEGSAPVNHVLLNRALEKIARGLYFHHTNGGRKLLGRLHVLPTFLGVAEHASPEEKERILKIERITKQQMAEQEMIGALREYFAYQVIDGPKVLYVNMCFLSSKTASVIHLKA